MKKLLTLSVILIISSCSRNEEVIPIKENKESCIKNKFIEQRIKLSGLEGLVKVWNCTYEIADYNSRFNFHPYIDSLLPNKFYWLPNGKIVEYAFKGTSIDTVMDLGKYNLQYTKLDSLKNEFNYLYFDKLDSTSIYTSLINTSLSAGNNPFILSTIEDKKWVGSLFITPYPITVPLYKRRVRIIGTFDHYEFKTSEQIYKIAQQTLK